MAFELQIPAVMDPNNKDGCPHIQGCSLYPLLTLETSLTVWQSLYCNGKFEKCERYQRSLSGQSVPSHLLPDGTSLEVPT